MPDSNPPNDIPSAQDILVEVNRVFVQLKRTLEPLVTDVSRVVGPIAKAWMHMAPVVTAVAREFAELDRAKALRERGWLPHYTMPFDKISACWPDDAQIQRVISAHYDDNWVDVRWRIEQRLSTYEGDDEARATFQEALDDYEAHRYRSVCRVLFPEIERLARTQIFDGQLVIPSNVLVKRLVDRESGMGLKDFWFDGFYDLCLFEYVTQHISDREWETPKGEPQPIPQGLYTQVKKSHQLDAALASPIPNRHAAIHGLVAYRTKQNALNAIFIADYMFAVISRLVQMKFAS